MKQKTIFLSLAWLLCLLANTAFAQKDYYRISRWDDGAKRTEVAGSGNDSLLTGYYQNGNREQEGRYMYGKFIGAWNYWYPNGNKQLVMYFDSLNISTLKTDKVSKGLLIRAIGYHETGEIQRFESYAEGKHIATTSFYKNGHVEALIIYDTNENPSQQTTWYNNGNMKELAMFTKTFKTEKSGKKEVTHLEMVPLPYKVWHENGQVATNGQVDNGKKMGVWRNYDTDGNLIKTDEF